ncbi:MAG TPA: hypothetical protein VJ952_09730 [Opitutales bacterium]|nr:hypothetical protein [Opitutales bacterium]
MKLLNKLFIIALCMSMPMTLSTFSTLEAKKKDKGGGNSGGGNSGGGNSGGGSKIGDASGTTVTKFHLSSWRVRGDYEIVGPTIMVIDGDLNIGNNTITIASTGSLELYVGGDIDANGRGSINNTGVPSQLIVLGTHPTKQPTESPDYSWTLSGNGALTGVVYAPNAEYRTNGGGNAGQTSGSVVALDVRFNGSPGPFHFDEALEDLDLGLGNYSLSTYELKPNGNSTASEKGEAVFGSTDYKSLFEQLF